MAGSTAPRTSAGRADEDDRDDVPGRDREGRSSGPTIAIVHDYLTQYGGAERVLEAIHALWPGAPVFTSLHDPAAFPSRWRDWDIRESPLGRVPGARRHHRRLLPLYPAAFASFGRELRAFDVVVSSTSAWAHHAGGPDNVRVGYCHSPARFLWGDVTYLDVAGVPAPLRRGFEHGLAPYRWLDRRAAGRLDVVVANSAAVAERIASAWHRPADAVIHPPVDLDRFAGEAAGEAEQWALTVSRLVPHKRIDLAVDACTAAGWPLLVVGTGPAEADLRRRAGPTVRFAGRATDAETADLMRCCRLLLVPGREDFGIAAVEAQAAGRPVVAFAGGGALETVADGRTGILFPDQTVASLTAGVERARQTAWSADACRDNAARFGAHRFAESFGAIVEGAWSQRRAR